MSTHTHTLDWTQAPAVLNVLNQYAHALDSGDIEMMASAFSDNATSGGVVANSDARWGPWTGNRAIAEHLKALRETQHDQRRHQVTTPIFTHLSSDKATVKAFLALFATPDGGKPGFLTSGEYLVQFSCIDGIWKIDQLDGVLDGEF